MSSDGTEARIGVLEHRMGSVEELISDAIGEIRDGIREIATNTGKLAVLEERHAETRDSLERAFESISKCEVDHKEKDKRIHAIEIAMPGLKETRRWVVGGILAVVAIVGTALITIVVKSAEPAKTVVERIR